MSLFDGYIVNQEIITLIKIYPDFVRLYKYANPFYVRRFDFDPYSSRPKKKKRLLDPDTSDNSSLNRSKTRVMDMALCNDFNLMTTFTFAKDRNNVDAKKRQMGFWLNNQRILHGNFSYILIPEYHGDKKAIHFHGLFSGYKGTLVDSGHKTKHGRKVLNITSYRAGYSTGVEIDDIQTTSGYVAKYLTKEMPQFKNKQRYWCSNGLKRPLKIVNPLLTDQDKLLFKLSYSDKQKEIFEYSGQLTDADIARIADYGKRRYDDLQVAER